MHLTRCLQSCQHFQGITRGGGGGGVTGNVLKMKDNILGIQYNFWYCK